MEPDREPIDRRLIAAAETIEADVGRECDASRLLRDAAVLIVEMREVLEKCEVALKIERRYTDGVGHRVHPVLIDTIKRASAAIERAKGGGS